MKPVTTTHLRDPELDRLVRELNTGGSASAGIERPASEGSERVSFSSSHQEGVARLMTQMIETGATDLHLVVGVPPALRLNGEIRYASDSPVTAETVAFLLSNARNLDELKERGSVDFSMTATDGDGEINYRFRVNVHRQRGALAASIRVLPTRVPSLTELNLPTKLAELIRPSRGLVLVCGPTGSGKSTTLAALLEEINRTQARHIITIEDPLEYEHRNRLALVEQIEIGKDAPTFADALRSALRQDPDVILVGEMRDLETVSIALTAAETGHLIFSTLHTSGPAQSINRIVDVYPSSQQTQVYKQIALSLHAVLHQRMLPRAGGKGIVPAVELLIANYSVRHQIRWAKLEGLANEIALGKRQGMISFDDSLADLVARKLITPEEALNRSDTPEELRKIVGEKTR